MSDDIRRILESLDAAQRGVKQLPALFKPKDTSPQLNGPYPGDNATRGYLVGESEDDVNPMAQAVTRRIVNQHPEWLMKYGPQAVMQAIDDVTDGESDWEEIGSSDVSAYVHRVRDYLRDHHGSREEMDDRQPFAESATTEDVVSDVKRRLGDYLQDVASAIKTDGDLKDKDNSGTDQLVSAVKTVRTDDGHEIKIHGNEDDGFRVSIRDRDLPTKFKNLDEAAMACEMYCARRRNMMQSRDYVDEA